MNKSKKINERMIYYLKILFEIGKIEIDYPDKFIKDIKSCKLSEMIKKWEELLKQSFQQHIGITVAVYYALKGNVENCNNYLRLMQTKIGVSEAQNIIMGLLMYETQPSDLTLPYLNNLPIAIMKMPFIIELKAEIHFKEKNYGQAEKLFKQLIGKVEDQSSVYSRLGEIYLIHKDIERSETMFFKAIELDYKNILAHLYLGDIYKLKGNIEKAKREYSISAAIDLNNQVSVIAQQKLFLLINQYKENSEKTV